MIGKIGPDKGIRRLGFLTWLSKWELKGSLSKGDRKNKIKIQGFIRTAVNSWQGRWRIKAGNLAKRHWYQSLKDRGRFDKAEVLASWRKRWTINTFVRDCN